MNPLLPPLFSQLPKDITSFITGKLETENVASLRATSRQWRDYPELGQTYEDMQQAGVLITGEFIPGLVIRQPPPPESMRFLGGARVEPAMEKVFIARENERQASGFYKMKNAETRERAVKLIIEWKTFQKQLQTAFKDIKHDMPELVKSLEEELNQQLDNKNQEINEGVEDPWKVMQANSVHRVKLAMLKQEAVRIRLSFCLNKAERNVVLGHYFGDSRFFQMIEEDGALTAEPNMSEINMPAHFKQFYLEEYIALGFSSSCREMAIYVRQRQENELCKLDQWFTSQRGVFSWDVGKRIDEVINDVWTRGLSLAGEFQGEDMTVCNAFFKEQKPDKKRRCHII